MAMIYVPQPRHIEPVQLMGRTGAMRSLGGAGLGGLTGIGFPDPPPPPPSPPGPFDLAGYGASTTGGGATVTHGVNAQTSDAWPKLKAALLSSGTRHIKIIGSNDIEGQWEDVVVTHGNLTFEGEEWSGFLKHYHQLLFKNCSNVYLHHLGLAPGDRVGNVEDSAAVKLNAVKLFAIVRSVLRWGADVIIGINNDCWDGTLQENVLGPALYESHIHKSPNGYGPNITTTTGGADYGKRISFIRNFINNCERRNIRAQGTDFWEAVNNAVYNAGAKVMHGNPRGANLVGQMVKKGPQSENNEGWESEISGGDYTSFFPAAVYLDDNIGLTAAGAPFTLVHSFGGAGNPRATPYGGGLHNVTAAAASAALFEEVIAEAGRGFDDAVSAAVKAHALAGTSAGFYNGVGFPAPNSD